MSDEIDQQTVFNYNCIAKKCLPEAPLVFVDDFDIIKSYGRKFEDLGVVRDESSKEKKHEKGYYVTEVTALTRNSNHPISLFSKIHPSHEKDYVSANANTYDTLKKTSLLAGKNATFFFDRGYDMNDLFSFCYKNDIQFIIRLTAKRLLFYKGKWFKSTTLRDSRKGKIKTNIMFEEKKQPCYITCVNAQITEARKQIKVIFVYGLGETPTMLATNREIRSKDDTIHVVRAYLKRWRIEEYFIFTFSLQQKTEAAVRQPPQNSIKILHCVHPCPIDIHFKMDVRTCRVARFSHISYHLSLLHLLTCRNVKR